VLSELYCSKDKPFNSTTHLFQLATDEIPQEVHLTGGRRVLLKLARRKERRVVGLFISIMSAFSAFSAFCFYSCLVSGIAVSIRHLIISSLETSLKPEVHLSFLLHAPKLPYRINASLETKIHFSTIPQILHLTIHYSMIRITVYSFTTHMSLQVSSH
jgi:hypothetical protein